MDKQFLKANAIQSLERVEGIGYLIKASNGKELFLTDELIIKMREGIENEQICGAQIVR